MAEELSAIEAIMLRVGQDATLRMTVGALMVLDRAPTVEALAERLAFAAEHAPRLAQHADDAGGLRSRAVWVDDVDPAPHQHLRTVAIAEPGSMRQVLDLVELLEPVPFDPEKSPWDITLIDGLEEGKAALYLRAHHVLTDGTGGIRLLGLMLDESEWPRAPLTTGEPEPRHDDGDVKSERTPGTVTLTATIDVPRAVGRVFDTVNAAREIDPVVSAVRTLQGALDVANSVSRQLMVTGGPLTSRPVSRSMLSRIEVISIEGARAAALALGGSRNDLLVAAAAAGIGNYHEHLGERCGVLRLATPTSQRRGLEAGGNWFSPTRIEVPTGVGRHGSQFGVVVERLAQARQEPAVRVASAVASTIRRLPTRLLLPALRAQADSVDFVATVVPGLRRDRHVCGSLIEVAYPLGPRLGCPMNITAFGNESRLDIGIAIDPAVVRQADLLIECLKEAFESFGATGGNGRRDGAASVRTGPGTATTQRATARHASD